MSGFGISRIKPDYIVPTQDPTIPYNIFRTQNPDIPRARRGKTGRAGRGEARGAKRSRAGDTRRGTGLDERGGARRSAGGAERFAWGANSRSRPPENDKKKVFSHLRGSTHM